MKKLLTIILVAFVVSGCSSIQTAENVKALRLVNLAEANLTRAENKKDRKEKEVAEARLEVIASKLLLEKAKENFEETYNK